MTSRSSLLEREARTAHFAPLRQLVRAQQWRREPSAGSLRTGDRHDRQADVTGLTARVPDTLRGLLVVRGFGVKVDVRRIRKPRRVGVAGEAATHVVTRCRPGSEGTHSGIQRRRSPTLLALALGRERAAPIARGGRVPPSSRAVYPPDEYPKPAGRRSNAAVPPHSNANCPPRRIRE